MRMQNCAANVKLFLAPIVLVNSSQRRLKKQPQLEYAGVPIGLTC